MTDLLEAQAVIPMEAKESHRCINGRRCQDVHCIVLTVPVVGTKLESLAGV